MLVELDCCHRHEVAPVEPAAGAGPRLIIIGHG
jgi:hypothetical protein